MKKEWGMILALFIVLSCGVLSVNADEYPEKEITFLVGYSPGGSTDTTIRTIAPQMAKILGQTIVVSNKPGAGGSLALGVLSKAKPDGYTLCNFNISAPIGVVIRKTDTFNVVSDFKHICNLTSFPNIVVVPANSKINSLDELVQEAKKRPGEITGATSGMGTSGNFALELFKKAAKVDITHVPHKGSAPAVTALLGGHIDCGFINSVDVLQHIKAGKLKALSVSSKQRIPEAPDLPTIGELGYPNATITPWIGCAAPAGTPDHIVKKLADTIQKVLQKEDVKQKLKKIGFTPTYIPPDEFTAFVKDEYERYKQLAEEAGIKK
jgi:tripartite-type tricarboxylate transporter receptor subunit TctC